MTSRRAAVIAAAVVAVIALAGVVTFAALRARSSDDSRRSSTPTTAPTAPPVTTVAPQTIPVPPLPPAGPTTAPPPAITVPPGGTMGTAPPSSTTPASTTPPTVTAAPASTTSPTTSTTKPTTSTTKPSTSTTKPSKVTRRTIVYTPAGAPKMRGDLVLPRQHQDTIIVLVHGGDGSTGSRKQMRGWSNFYATDGYASLAIDYLLAKPSSPSPVYPKPENDVKASVQYLRTNAEQLGINADRVIVHGFEAGAGLGAQALVGDAPGAFIGFSGRYDGSQRDPNRYYGGPANSPDPQVQERYATANSIAQAGSAAGPALLYAGEQDDAAVKSATSFRDALQNAGKDVTLTLVPGASSGFDQEKSGALTPAGQQAAQQALEWLQARFPPS
jgi:acetyl esterase/lipase